MGTAWQEALNACCQRLVRLIDRFQARVILLKACGQDVMQLDNINEKKNRPSYYRSAVSLVADYLQHAGMSICSM